MVTETIPTTEQETMAEQETATSRRMATIAVSMPLDMKRRIEDRAKAENLPSTVFSRRTLANAIGYTLVEPPAAVRRKYASEEDKKAARKQRQDLVRRLLEAHARGAIDLETLLNA